MANAGNDAFGACALDLDVLLSLGISPSRLVSLSAKHRELRLPPLRSLADALCSALIDDAGGAQRPKSGSPAAASSVSSGSPSLPSSESPWSSGASSPGSEEAERGRQRARAPRSPPRSQQWQPSSQQSQSSSSSPSPRAHFASRRYDDSPPWRMVSPASSREPVVESAHLAARRRDDSPPWRMVSPASSREPVVESPEGRYSSSATYAAQACQSWERASAVASSSPLSRVNESSPPPPSPTRRTNATTTTPAVADALSSPRSAPQTDMSWTSELYGYRLPAVGSRATDSRPSERHDGSHPSTAR